MAAKDFFSFFFSFLSSNNEISLKTSGHLPFKPKQTEGRGERNLIIIEKSKIVMSYKDFFFFFLVAKYELQRHERMDIAKDHIKGYDTTRFKLCQFGSKKNLASFFFFHF
jgi:hypothetical protein